MAGVAAYPVSNDFPTLTKNGRPVLSTGEGFYNVELDFAGVIQNGIDYIATNGGGVLQLGAKTYQQEVTLRSNVRLVGCGRSKTVIKGVVSSSSLGVVTIDQAGGEVTRTGLFNLGITGVTENTNQWAMYFKGVADSLTPFDGGLWYSEFEKITIRGTKAGGINLRGGTNSNLVPHQFLSFKDIDTRYTAGSHSAWVGIMGSGQVGQVHFDNCEFSGYTSGDGAKAVYLCREVDDAGTVGITDSHPYAIKFTECTFQNVDTAAYVDRAEGVTFDTCWFEDNKRGIRVLNAANGVVATACSFSDSAADGSNTGYCMKVEGSCTAVADACVVRGNCDDAWVDPPAGATLGHLFVRNCIAGTEPHTNYPRGLTSASTVVTGYMPYVILTGTTTVNTITSYLAGDDFLTVRASGSAVTFGLTSGNIRSGSGSSGTFVLQDGSVAVFKVDRAIGRLLLVSSNNNPVDVQTFTASGTWTKPALATKVEVFAVGGGGGGGSGRQGAAASVRSGGAGGGGGAYMGRTFDASGLASTVTVTVGAAGAGGAAQSSADSNGTAGGNGTTSSFGSYLRAPNGSGGAAGSAAAAAAGGGGTGLASGSAGAASSATGAAGSAAGASGAAAAGGGSGGGITTGDVASTGGSGGAIWTHNYGAGAAGTSGGGNGGTATDPPAATRTPGAGGGGGGSSTTTAGGNGGNGASYGGGGGGGGASLNGFASGAGGNGAAGIVIVISQ